MHHRIFVFSIVATAAALSGCGAESSSSKGSNDSPFDDLFDTPTSDPTPDSMYGVWAVANENDDIKVDGRYKLEESAVTMAARCTYSDGSPTVTVGIEVAATVDDNAISIRESKTEQKASGKYFCRASITPLSVKNCAESNTPSNFRKSCFVLDGTEIELYGDAGEKAVWTKVSD